MNKKLRQARNRRHWSIEEAAARIGVSRQTLIRWEQGTQIPHGSSLRMTCEAFGLSATQLGFGESDIEARFLTWSPAELFRWYNEEVLQVNAWRWVLPHVLLFDNSQWRLRVEDIHFYVEEHPFTIPAAIAPHTCGILEELKTHFFDSATIRLERLIHQEDSLTLVIRKAHYYDYLGTNYVMDVLRDIVHADGKLEPLDASLLANHMGVSVLVFTSDDWLILPLRAQERVGIWQNMLMPSISGACSYDDDVQGSPVFTVKREGRDELRLENADFGSITFLGMTRELLRGGKPEAFFAAHLTISRSVVEQRFSSARDRWENQDLQWVADVPAVLHKFEKMSQSLQVNLALWHRCVEEEKHHGH